MNNLLIVIACCADDAPQAERLLDWIYQLNGRQAKGHVLLSYAHDIHQEMKIKLRICAELAFESVSEFQASNRMLPSPQQPLNSAEPKTKVEFTNNLWNQTANHIAKSFRWPWLWCEPDSVPLTPDWIDRIATAYSSQPKKYMGRRMKRMVGEVEHFFLSRTAVYHTGAQLELGGFIGSPPFEWASGNLVMPKAHISKLIQVTAYDGDFAKVAPDAVLLHSDKTGKLIQTLRELGVDSAHENGKVERVNVYAPLPPEKAVIPILHKREVDVPMPENNRLEPEPPDKRTKAWKEWKAKQNV